MPSALLHAHPCPTLPVDLYSLQDAHFMEKGPRFTSVTFQAHHEGEMELGFQSCSASVRSPPLVFSAQRVIQDSTGLRKGTAGWMDEYMYGWMDRWVRGWIGGWMDEYMDGWVDRWVGGWMSAWMGGWRDGWMGGWVVSGWIDGWMDAWLAKNTFSKRKKKAIACFHTVLKTLTRTIRRRPTDHPEVPRSLWSSFANPSERALPFPGGM